MNPLVLAAIIVGTGFTILNVVAYRHAYAMLHFNCSGEKTEKPEAMSWVEKLNVLAFGVRIPKPVNSATPADIGLPFTVHQLRAADGVQLEGWHIPGPDPKGMVVLFHGYADAKASMLGNAKVMHHMGFSTFLIDFRGSGGSEGSYTTVGHEEAADVAAAVACARELLPGKSLALYGRSMGGAAILRALSVGSLEPDAVIIEAVFDSMLSTVRNRFTAMKVPSFPCAQLLTLWGGRQMGFSAFGHNPADYAADVRCPVLVLHGEQDPRATAEQARKIFDNLAGPKRIEFFHGTGHESCRKANPEEWERIVSEFLTSATTPR